MFRPLLAAAVAAPVPVILPPAAAEGAAPPPADRVELRRAESPLPLDPTLADPRWGQGALTGPLVDLGTRAPALVATSVSFWYDDRALYVGVRSEQKTPVVATQATNDVGYGSDDFVAVELDVSGSGQ